MRAVAIAFLGVLLGGCASGTASGPPPGTGPARVASMTVTGGLCEYGPCREDFDVDADGGWRRTEGGRVVAGGRFSADDVRALSAAVDRSAITAGPLPPFTGTCPTVRDEAEVGYEFSARGVTYRASTCGSVVPPDDPGVRALQDLRARTIPTG